MAFSWCECMEAVDVHGDGEVRVVLVSVWWIYMVLVSECWCMVYGDVHGDGELSVVLVSV